MKSIAMYTLFVMFVVYVLGLSPTLHADTTDKEVSFCKKYKTCKHSRWETWKRQLKRKLKRERRDKKIQRRQMQDEDRKLTDETKERTSMRKRRRQERKCRKEGICEGPYKHFKRMEKYRNGAR